MDDGDIEVVCASLGSVHHDVRSGKLGLLKVVSRFNDWLACRVAQFGGNESHLGVRSSYARETPETEAMKTVQEVVAVLVEGDLAVHAWACCACGEDGKAEIEAEP